MQFGNCAAAIPSLRIRWGNWQQQAGQNGIDTAPPALNLTVHLQTDFNLKPNPAEAAVVVVVAAAADAVVGSGPEVQAEVPEPEVRAAVKAVQPPLAGSGVAGA